MPSPKNRWLFCSAIPWPVNVLPPCTKMMSFGAEPACADGRLLYGSLTVPLPPAGAALSTCTTIIGVPVAGLRATCGALTACVAYTTVRLRTTGSVSR